MTEAILLSAAGGAAYQLFPFIEGLRGGNTIPSQLNWRTMIFLVSYAILGALIGYAYFDSTNSFNKMLAIHVGASAPLILRTLGTTVPKIG